MYEVPENTLTEALNYVLVADAGRARVFIAAHEDSALSEIADFVNPEARLTPAEAESDRHGHVMHGTAGIGHTFEPRHSNAEHAAEVFAEQVCSFLHDAWRSGLLRRLYLVADPSFLGVLRKALDPATARCVVKETAADYTRLTAADIRRRLPRCL